MSVFETLNSINVNDKTEKKNGLTYLSWAWAWAEIKKLDPKATYTIYENADGWFYHTDGLTAWVKTGVTVDGLEHIEYLPVMDYRNKSIPAGNITSFDVNKAIQRSLTKACARHGLGLYIYAGEDLPDSGEMVVPAQSYSADPGTINAQQIEIIGCWSNERQGWALKEGSSLMGDLDVQKISDLSESAAQHIINRVKKAEGKR